MKKTFRCDGYFHYLNCDDSFMCQNLSHKPLKNDKL